MLHLAAFTHVDQCEAEPEKAFVVNGLGPRNSSIAAAEVGAAVMALSTDYVFDGASATPRREHDPIGPLGVYGKSKLAGERGAREVNPRHVIVRTAWLYGAGGRNFVDTIVAKARAGEPLRVVDDQRGAPTWTHDLSEAMLALIERREFGTYHVTNSGNCTWYDLAVAACAILGFVNPGIWFLGAGLELGYLWLLVSNPRFRNALSVNLERGAWSTTATWRTTRRRASS